MIKQSRWRSWLFANHAPRTRQTRRHGAAGDANDTSYTNDTSDAGRANPWSPGRGPRRAVGPIGTSARLVAGLLLVGNVAYGQLATHHVRPATWALGLLGFPVLMLAWHVWRIHRDPARFSETSPLSFAVGALLFLVPYLTWWYAPALSVISDASLIFFGSAMLLTALRGDAGCEILTPSNWLLRRDDQIACAVFAPFDALDQRGVRGDRGFAQATETQSGGFHACARGRPHRSRR